LNGERFIGADQTFTKTMGSNMKIQIRQAGIGKQVFPTLWPVHGRTCTKIAPMLGAQSKTPHSGGASR